jgi:hypothetical protein
MQQYDYILCSEFTEGRCIEEQEEMDVTFAKWERNKMQTNFY